LKRQKVGRNPSSVVGPGPNALYGVRGATSLRRSGRCIGFWLSSHWIRDYKYIARYPARPSIPSVSPSSASAAAAAAIQTRYEFVDKHPADLLIWCRVLFLSAGVIFVGSIARVPYQISMSFDGDRSCLMFLAHRRPCGGNNSISCDPMKLLSPQTYWSFFFRIKRLKAPDFIQSHACVLIWSRLPVHVRIQ
jgi:hypothetical protein